MLLLEIFFIIRLFRPTTLSFIIKEQIFEVIVLLALMQMIVLLFQLIRQAPKKICKHEYELENAVRDFIQTNDRVYSVHVLSCGLGSKINFITDLRKGKERVPTEVLVQDPKYAIDKVDAERTSSNFKILNHDHSEKSLQMRLFNEPATMRAVLICKKDRKPIWGVVSWYKYRDYGKGRMAVKGRDNPAFVLDSGASSIDDIVLEFFMDEFEWLWKKSNKFTGVCT